MNAHEIANESAAAFTHSGQACLCTERVCVRRPIFNDCAAAPAARARALDPSGPIIFAEQRNKGAGQWPRATLRPRP